MRAVALEISVAYAVWSAVVMAALAAIGMTVLGESITTAKVSGITAIVNPVAYARPQVRLRPYRREQRNP